MNTQRARTNGCPSPFFFILPPSLLPSFSSPSHLQLPPHIIFSLLIPPPLLLLPHPYTFPSCFPLPSPSPLPRLPPLPSLCLTPIHPSLPLSPPSPLPPCLFLSHSLSSPPPCNFTPGPSLPWLPDLVTVIFQVYVLKVPTS